jgi:hypothetical protein
VKPPHSSEMSSFFNPANPRFRRGVTIFSAFSCTVVATHIVMADFGSQEHIFSPVQRYIIPRVDEFFEVTEEEIVRSKLDRSSILVGVRHALESSPPSGRK